MTNVVAAGALRIVPGMVSCDCRGAIRDWSGDPSGLRGRGTACVLKSLLSIATLFVH